MASTSYSFESKTIDELQEIGKLSGSEKTIISIDQDTKKVSIDTIVGYAANLIAQNMSGSNATTPTAFIMSSSNSSGGCIIIVPEGTEIPINLRSPGTIYLERTHQSSIRTKINVPTSVVVSGNLGLKRV